MKKDISLFGGVLEINSVDVRIVKEVKDWSVYGTSTSFQNLPADQPLQASDILLDIYKTNKNEETSVRATLPNVNLQDLLQLISLEKDEFQISNSFPDLLNFGFNHLDLYEEKDGFR